MIDISEFDENLLNTETQYRRRTDNQQTKRQVPLQRSSSSVYGKDLHKNVSDIHIILQNDIFIKFLDRYEMYLQQRLIHRHELISKIERQTALANERQMEFQHRLYKPEHNIQFDDGKKLKTLILIKGFLFLRFMFTCCFYAFSFW